MLGFTVSKNCLNYVEIRPNRNRPNRRFPVYGYNYSVLLLIKSEDKKPVVHKFNASNRLYSLMFSSQ